MFTTAAFAAKTPAQDTI